MAGWASCPMGLVMMAMTRVGIRVQEDDGRDGETS